MKEKFPDWFVFWIPGVATLIAMSVTLSSESSREFGVVWTGLMLAMTAVWAVFAMTYTAAERRIGTLLKRMLGQEGYDMRLKLTPKLGGVEHSVSTYSATSDLQTTEIFSLKFSWFSTLLRHKYIATQLHSYSLLLESKWRKKLEDGASQAAGGSGVFSPQLWGNNLLKQYSQALGIGSLLGQGLQGVQIQGSSAAEQAMKQNYAQHKIAQLQSTLHGKPLADFSLMQQQFAAANKFAELEKSIINEQREYAMNNALNKLNAATQALDDMEP